ncbi:MAG: glyoxalase [Acidimicrobiaceae bacterium]|nr:glyoxalase [Acidimicrobiaceae bacterium]|tara:strand:+ start:2925 stop:3500 length:576 start_codon:yes stop_codon:yes gene_type:complete
MEETSEQKYIPQWGGIHHLAMITPDMDETVRFYSGVLQMPLVATLRAESMRHYFFQLAPGNTIAFFEVAEAEKVSKLAGLMTEKNIQFDHLSFFLSTEQELLLLADRLKEENCEVTALVDHGIIRSIYFHDNNGIALEASCWTVDIDDLGFKPDDEILFADPEPVPAIKELQNGTLQNIPSTKFPEFKPPL